MELKGIPNRLRGIDSVASCDLLKSGGLAGSCGRHAGSRGGSFVWFTYSLTLKTLKLPANTDCVFDMVAMQSRE